ncbi:MAG: sulfatase-like hydrolase/transferase [Planctomycetaceae bacterium]|nr:sulfatase-like hydrolase/transferase [Planctomycetaceae bacterium]
MRVVFLLAALLFICASSSAQTNRHVIQLSVDGLHSEGLRRLLDSQPDSFGNFQRFVDEGSTTFNARTDYSNTFTLPNHATMLTGRPVNQSGDDASLHHGYTNNSTPRASDTLHNAGNPKLSYVPSTFDIAHDLGLKTGFYANKSKFVIFEQSYNSTDETDGGRRDQALENGDQGTDKIDRYLFLNSNGTSSELIDHFVLEMPIEKFNYTFLHLAEPDVAGHRWGWRTESWDASVALVDQHLGRVFEMIEQNDSLRENTTIVLTSDHGGLGLFHDDATNPNMHTVPFFVWGKQVSRGTDLYEVSRGTRLRPQTDQIPYEALWQPIRNGDGANLSMSLLGLPSVDGSIINARQDLLIDHAGQAVWHGSDPTAGDPGNGKHWDDPLNWSRTARQDTIARPGDHLLFSLNSESQVVHLDGPRTIYSAEFQGDYLLDEGDLHIISGLVDLADNVFVEMNGRMTSATSLIVRGTGLIEINGVVPDLLRAGGPIGGEFEVEGSATFFNDVRPGDQIGAISVERDLTLGGASVLQMQIGAAADGSPVNDSVYVGNRLIIRGGMSVETTDGYLDPVNAAEFDQFRFLSVGRRVGNLRFFEYDGESLRFDSQTATSQTHFAGDGLFRILEHDANGVSLTNYRAFAGDATGDGAFDTQDLVAVFQFGAYEDGENGNADWLSGDWDHDGDFTTSDLVLALATGRFEQPPVFGQAAAHLVPEPQIGFLLPLLVLWVSWRRQRPS